MEALGINLKFLLIQLANFILFYFLFTKFLLTPVKKMLDERKKRIAEGLEAAEKAKEELVKVEELKVEAKKKAKAEEKTVLDEAREKAEKEAAVIIEKAKQKAAKIVKDAETGIENIQAGEMKKMREKQLKIIEAVIEKIMDEKFESVDLRAKYQKVMGELYKDLS